MDIVRLGIIGVGGMGTAHLNYIGCKHEIEGVKLTAIADIAPEKLAAAKKKLENENGGSYDVAVFEDYVSLLDSGLVDAVLIATPHYLHPVIGIEALNRGIHVLSEKPIGVYTKKVEELYEVAKKSGKVFGIMYNQRTDPMYRKMREIVQSGELGELKRIIWIITNWYRTQSYYNSGGWRATWKGEGGGVLINQCPHNLDLWQWITGMPCRIRGFLNEGQYHDIEVEDNATIYAEYANGAVGTFITTTGEAPGTNRLEISGTRGKLVSENAKLTFYRLKVDEREFNANSSSTSITGEDMEVIDVDYGEYTTLKQHKGITQNFVNAILKGEELIAPGYDGINGLTISNAAMLSSWTDAWVNLPIDKELFLKKLNEKIECSKEKSNVNERVLDTEGTYGEQKKIN
ncbi:MAG: Gfo/Idh/MocA family oxidoreductase [Ruminococcaceae bacterium]|nr:Gfo/Idh/MocA family oxidoreductase [Oscillospiraceae bacterium]